MKTPLLALLLAACTVQAGNPPAPQQTWKPRYVVRFELSQSHFTLSIKQHIKDASNKVTFDVPVDKDYYDSVNVGQEIVDKFRTGSMHLYGSYGSWKVKVINKAVY